MGVRHFAVDQRFLRGGLFMLDAVKYLALLLLMIAAPVFAQDGGTEPTYTTEPVTQQVPHCQAGQKLKQFDPAFSYLVVTWQLNGTLPPEHGDRWIDAGDTAPVLRSYQTFRCFDDPPVLHRRDETGPVGDIVGNAATPTTFTDPMPSTEAVFTVSGDVAPSFTEPYPGEVYTFPKGTTCSESGDFVVCQMPKQGK